MISDAIIQVAAHLRVRGNTGLTAYAQPAYLQVLLREFNDAHPAPIVQDLILGQHKGNAVILLHYHPPQGGAQEKFLPLQQLHWLLNVSVQLSRPCNFPAHWGHVVTKRRVLALLLVELREKGCRSSHTHHQTMARILWCLA